MLQRVGQALAAASCILSINAYANCDNPNLQLSKSYLEVFQEKKVPRYAKSIRMCEGLLNTKNENDLDSCRWMYDQMYFLIQRDSCHVEYRKKADR